MAVSQTSVLLGQTEPRLWTPPRRELTPETSLGFEAIEFSKAVLGFDLLPWQEWVLIHGLELNPDGTYRFRTLVVLVSRQNGKTTLLSVLALWRMYMDGARMVLGTSTNLSMAEDAWMKSVDLAESTPELNELVDSVIKGSGNKQLVLTTGEKYRVAASNRRGGRGLSVDLALLDELREHTTYEAWSSVSKTTLARTHAQAWCFSNAGDIRSIVLRDLRDKALAAEDSDLGIFEWSAPGDAEVDDRSAWAQANPALGYTITEPALASALSTDPEHVFRTEALCQWVDSMSDPVFGRGAWEACITHDSTIEASLSFGVAVSYDRAWACIGGAGLNAEGQTHVEPIEYKRGTSWIASRVLDLLEHHGRATPVVVDGRGPAASLIHDLENAGVDVTVASTQDVTDGCAAFYDAVQERNVAHFDDPDLNNAVSGAKKRDVGDRWAWGRKQSTNDTSPLEAVTLAAWAVAQGSDSDPLKGIW